MISSFLLLLGAIGVGLYDYFYRSSLLNRERNRFCSDWTTLLFLLVAGWEAWYWQRTESTVALLRCLLAGLGSGVVFCARRDRFGKRNGLFYGELVASWVGFSMALTSYGAGFLIWFLGWEWGWFWLIRLIGFYYRIPENRFFGRVMHGVSFLSSFLIGFGLYGTLYSGEKALPIFCFLVGWGFRLGVVPFYFWVFRAVSVSPVGIFFTSVVFAAQAFGVCALGTRIEGLMWVKIQPMLEQVFLFLSLANLGWAMVLLFWQRSMRQWLFFLYLMQCGWVLFIFSQSQYQAGVIFCFLMAVINLGLWGILLKVREQNEGSDSIIYFIGLMDRRRILGIGFLIFLLTLIGVLVIKSFTFLFGAQLQQVVAGIAFVSLIACFQMLKKILIPQKLIK